MRVFRFLAVLVLAASCAGAQQATTWIVKPEWVRAHEEALASDAMHGRGSATHDEELAAQYVAKQFEGYGLQHAPGMETYIQSAELVIPPLNGHSKLTVGELTFEEGKDFDLLFSPGVSKTGRFYRVSGREAPKVKDLKSDVPFVTDLMDGEVALAAVGDLRGSDAGTILIPADKSTDGLFARMGGKTRLPVRFKDDAPGPMGATVVALQPEAYKRLLALKSGPTVTLTLYGSVAAKPRFTFNAIGYLPGTDASAGTLLLTAHLDHLGMGKPVDGDGIWNGANDDAAGTTAVLELAHALASGPKLRRSVLFVCYGSEELGGFGSRYFGAHPPVPLKDLVANIEFEMIGNQDPKMPPGVLLFTGWPRSNLGPTLAEHGALLGPDPYPEEHFFERSDNYSLALKGVVAHTAAGWGTVPTYHQPDDDIAHLNLPFMTSAIQSLVEPVRWLASSDFVPKWNKGGRPKEDDQPEEATAQKGGKKGRK